jgi:hypothetical protein
MFVAVSWLQNNLVDLRSNSFLFRGEKEERHARFGCPTFLMVLTVTCGVNSNTQLFIDVPSRLLSNSYAEQCLPVLSFVHSLENSWITF